MVAEQKIHTSPAESSGCDDHSLLSLEEQIIVPRVRRTDASIAIKIDRALQEIEVLHSLDYEEMDVDVRDGVVSLSGHSTNTSNQLRVETAARAIPGVLDVKSYLVADDSLLREVAGVLGKIEHEYGVKFFAGVQNGVVGLHGEVGSASVRSLAEQHVANIPGVRGVVNFVRTPGVDLEAEDQRFLQPVIGEQIYFCDGVLSGTVQRVIIHPRNRRVVAMIIQRQIFNRWPKIGSLKGNKPFITEGLIIIPINMIRHLTKNSGFLHSHSMETTRYRDFDPAFFIAPDRGWTPPYPYCPGDVLFPLESAKAMKQTGSEPAFPSALSPPTKTSIQPEQPY